MKNLFKILILSLLVFSCEEGDSGFSPSNEVDIDWILFKDIWIDPDTGDSTIYYILTHVSSISITLLDPTIEGEYDWWNDWSFSDNDNPTVSFIYNDQSFNFDVNGIGISHGFYLEDSYSRVIYNQEMEYLHCFIGGGSDTVDISSYEVIDYR